LLRRGAGGCAWRWRTPIRDAKEKIRACSVCPKHRTRILVVFAWARPPAKNDCVVEEAHNIMAMKKKRLIAAWTTCWAGRSRRFRAADRQLHIKPVDRAAERRVSGRRNHHRHLIYRRGRSQQFTVDAPKAAGFGRHANGRVGSSGRGHQYADEVDPCLNSQWKGGGICRSFAGAA